MDYINESLIDDDKLYEMELFNSELPCVHENDECIKGRKIYYISDIHVDLKDKKGLKSEREFKDARRNEDVKGFKNFTYEKYINHVVSKMNGDDPFGDNPLLIGGDISCFLWQVDYFFEQLRMRREGLIVFVLGNHEIWARDERKNRNLAFIIEEYRKICAKYDIILLHNEIIFFYDVRTGNGELLPFFDKTRVSASQLLSMNADELRNYAKKAKLIIYGGLGFSGRCKSIDKEGRIYNAEMNLYMDIVPTLEDDIKESLKCENAYRKVLSALGDMQVIIFTHCPLESWSDLEHNPKYIYINGHTHHNTFEMTKKRTVFADNQVGYYSDVYDLRYFRIDGEYDTFKDYKDGIYKITYEQYIDFNIGKNIKLKKRKDGKQIYMMKRSGFYMFVYFNANKELVLLNGGATRRLFHSLDYYYDNMGEYGVQLNVIMERYTLALNMVSREIQKIGGSGKIHGCIVDIDYYNHLYINPRDGRVIPYYAIDMTKKYVYESLKTLIENKCPRLVSNYKKYEEVEQDSFMLIPASFAVSKNAILETDRNMYKDSKIIRTIQYLLFQNVIRDWNDKILQSLQKHNEDAFEEIEKLRIDEKVLSNYSDGSIL